MKESSGISVGYLVCGIIFQLLFYGEASILSLWTWLHVLAWPFFLFIYAFWYVVLIAIVISLAILVFSIL